MPFQHSLAAHALRHIAAYQLATAIDRIAVFADDQRSGCGRAHACGVAPALSVFVDSGFADSRKSAATALNRKPSLDMLDDAPI
jgi:hypothetical protein